MDVFIECFYDYSKEGYFGVLQNRQHDVVRKGTPLHCEICLLLVLFNDSHSLVSYEFVSE